MSCPDVVDKVDLAVVALNQLEDLLYFSGAHLSSGSIDGEDTVKNHTHLWDVERTPAHAEECACLRSVLACRKLIRRC